MTIIDRITALETAIGVTNTKLQSLIDALDVLRGTGPENTIKSINQSIWNLVGPAPGRTLTEIHEVLAALKTNLGNPTGDATTTALGRLAAIENATVASNTALGGVPYEDLELASVRGFLNAIQGGIGGGSGLVVDGSYHMSSGGSVTVEGYRYATGYSIAPPIVPIEEVPWQVLANAETWENWEVFGETKSSIEIFDVDWHGIGLYGGYSWWRFANMWQFQGDWNRVLFFRCESYSPLRVYLRRVEST